MAANGSTPLTADDEVFLRDTYRKLEDRALQPDDPVYEPVYERPEGEDPVARMKKVILWAQAESFQLFSGFRGSGKTTELFRLKAELEREGCLVLYADAGDYLSLTEPTDITTLVFAVAGSFGEALSKKLGSDVLRETWWQRIRNYLTRTAAQVTEATAKGKVTTPAPEILGSLEAGVDLKVALKTAPSFRQKLHSFLENRLGDLRKEVIGFVEDGVRAVRTKSGSGLLPVVFLFDNFEQLRGGRTSAESVIRSVEEVFATHQSLLHLPLVHAVYTVPPWLKFVLPGSGTLIETLPCVRLWTNDAKRSVHAPGVVAFQGVVHRRLGDEGCRRLFGEGSKREERVNRLLTASGGHFRDLLVLLREVVTLAATWGKTLPVSQAVIDRAIANVQDQFLPIAIDDAKWLADIARRRDPALPSVGSPEIGRLSRFLDTHLVLYLTNGGDWYDIHPIIRDKVEEILAQSESLAATKPAASQQANAPAVPVAIGGQRQSRG